MLMTMVMSLTFIFSPRFFLFLIVGLGCSQRQKFLQRHFVNYWHFLASFKFPYQNEKLNLKTNTWQQLDAMQKKIQADWKHNGSFLLNAPWQNPWSSGPWQNPWMLRFIISMGFAMELWENPLHGKTHISWVLPWYMGFAIDLWQNPWDTLIRPRHAARYPHVKWEIENLSQITTTAPIFLQFNYFRQKYL